MLNKKYRKYGNFHIASFFNQNYRTTLYAFN